MKKEAQIGGVPKTADTLSVADVRHVFETSSDASAVRDCVRVLGTGGSITFELLRNGTAVPGFIAVFVVGGLIGNQVIIAGPALFSQGDRLDLRATADGISNLVDVSATIGIE